MAFKSSTVNASKVAATLSNFPSFVSPSRIGITTLAQAQSSRFYADSGKVVEWAREVVSENEIHVKIPSLTTTVTQYCDYDGIRSDYATTDTYGRNAVWSAYKAVWHLENSSGDSTSGAFNGTDTNITYGTSYGKIRGGLSANGTNNKVDFATMAASGSVARTFSTWIKTTDTQGGIFSYGALSNNNYFAFSVGATGSNNGRLDCGNWNGNGVVASGNAVNDGNWHRIGVSYVAGAAFNATNIKLYVDGVAVSASGGSGQVLNTTNSNYGFSYWRASNSFQITADLDEARFSLDTLSSDWFLTEYNNQNDESTFWGTWSDVGGGAPAQNSNFLMFM